MEEEKKNDLEEKQELHEEKQEKSEKVIERKKSGYEKGELLETVRGNPWIISTFVLGALVLILLISNLGVMTGGFITGGAIGVNEAGEKLLNFYQARGVEGLSLDSVEEESGLYKINFDYQGSIIPIYMTKDGKYLLAGNLNPIDFEASPQSQDIPKSDKPKVELFVMTHCPYGTQAEKGIIPTIKALGDTIDAKIRFVHYFMHDPEKEETPRQVCIREEQSEKYYAYLECFLEDGDSDRCLTEAGIDKNKLDSCIKNNAEGYYAADSELSKGYGVGGSPTLVINGQIVDSGRDSQSFLDTICSAFNNAPKECEQELSSTTPSPGFGYGEGSDTGASCE